MNDQIFFFFYNLAHQSQIFDAIVVFFAVYFPYLVVILIAIFFLFLHKRKEMLLVFFSGALAYVLAYVLKFIFHTLRPFDALPQVHALIPESGYAFPSGHATFFMALAVSIFFYHKKAGLPAQAGYVFMFFAFLIGLARIIAGVHFPIDILGGFILGGAISYLFAFFVKNV
jgi:undecaprenyl-diphosphatase